MELMTAMAVYGIFLAMLSGAFYALLTFGSRSQKVLVARERGRRVIEYVDSRIRNAGLGLHALKSSEEVRDALTPLTSSGNLLYKSPGLKLPVAVMYNYADGTLEKNDEQIAYSSQLVRKSTKAEDTEENRKIFIGNILILLYAERNTNSHVNLIIQIEPETSLDVQSRDVTTSLTDGKGFIFLDKDNMNYQKTGFIYNSRHKKDIRNWALLRGSGVPFATNKYKGTDYAEGIKLMTNKDAKVYAGDELLYLKCETIYADDPYTTDNDTVRNLKVQKLENKENPKKWGQVNPTETGILEIYAELNTRTNIFTLWVLSTGGKDSIVHERPSDWPVTARPTDWNSKNNFYKYETLYVSKASWKLNNIYEHFNWDN